MHFIALRAKKRPSQVSFLPIEGLKSRMMVLKRTILSHFWSFLSKIAIHQNPQQKYLEYIFQAHFWCIYRFWLYLQVRCALRQILFEIFHFLAKNHQKMVKNWPKIIVFRAKFGQKYRFAGPKMPQGPFFAWIVQKMRKNPLRAILIMYRSPIYHRNSVKLPKILIFSSILEQGGPKIDLGALWGGGGESKMC